jgi:hypothetical protein
MERIEGLEKAFKAISAVRKHARLRYGSGSPTSSGLSCPICKRGRLLYTVHHGGRIDGRCTTSGCVAWSNQ